MSTEPDQVIAFHTPVVTALPEIPLPEFCGPTPDHTPYTWTPEHRRKRALRARQARYRALAFYRIQAGRAAARGSLTAASWYAERASMYARLLRPRQWPPVEESRDLRDEVRSWVVMAEMIALEAHLTAEDYMYA